MSGAQLHEAVSSFAQASNHSSSSRALFKSYSSLRYSPALHIVAERIDFEYVMRYSICIIRHDPVHAWPGMSCSQV